MKYIISDIRKGSGHVWYVCARPGFMWTESGQKRDGTCSKNSGPEWTRDRNKALLFKSHRAAARIRTKTVSGKIQEIQF